MSTDGSLPQNSNHIIIDGISYIPSEVLLTGIEKLIFKDNRAFAVLDPQGQAPRIYSNKSELGLYWNDTRYLGIWEMTFNGMTLHSLAHELQFGGNTIVLSMSNPDFRLPGTGERVPRDTLLIRKIMTLSNDILYEAIEIKNFSSQRVVLQIEQWAGGRFDDIFEVRGFPRPKRGRMLPSEEEVRNKQRITCFRYEGLDGRVRKTYVHRLFDAEKIRVSPGLAGYFTRLEIPPKGLTQLKTIVSFEKLTDCRFHGSPYGDISIAEKMRLLKTGDDAPEFAQIQIESDNAIFNRSIKNSITDIYMLLTRETPDIVYPYAGIPWFSAPFGRDGIISAYQLLPWFPKIAKGVLAYCFQHLGTKVDLFTDEQPGKVFHELRRGEMAMTREVPFIPYYGSVDSTPLALILLHEYVRWTMDVESLRSWWSKAMKALAWIDKWGDPDGDGFLEYEKTSPTGLVNQGWKDSHDSVMHVDGRLALAPIRLCEVQGYSFRARMCMASLAHLLGHDNLSARLRREALNLKSQFIERFWDSKGEFLYLALDGDSEPCAVRSSNMGHCLWSQILPPERAADVSRLLMSDSMFSGHGIRTLSSLEVAYNPLSYHNGSVWPHDNSLIMEGMRLYGFHSHLERLSLAMLGVLEASSDFRLPELFCGFRKRGVEPPVPYEVACKPQAWSAGSLFLMLRSMLGMSIELDEKYLVFNNPILTPKIGTLEIRNLTARDWELDLVFRRASQGTTVEIIRKKGNVRVLTVK